MDIEPQLETKAGIPPEAYVTHGEMAHAFEQLKEANDRRLASQKRGGDVLLEEKVARLSDVVGTHQRQLDDINVKQARPPLSGEKAPPTHDQLEHKTAFRDYVRHGESANLRALEQKAMSVGSNPDGGYTVPVEIEKVIGERLTTISPIRRIAGVREISSNLYKKPFMIAGPAVGWVGESDPRTQTASPTLDSLSFPAMELYAQPAATATLLAIS
jgi:HK97 family phage major capsid protein